MNKKEYHIFGSKVNIFKVEIINPFERIALLQLVLLILKITPGLALNATPWTLIALPALFIVLLHVKVAIDFYIGDDYENTSEELDKD